MARLARIVIPGIPHHVTQRGNRRATVFWGDDDYAAYLDLVKEAAIQVGSEIWAYCLMPNHVHMIVVPRDEKGLRGLFADVHRQYTRRINARNKHYGDSLLLSAIRPINGCRNMRGSMPIRPTA